MVDGHSDLFHGVAVANGDGLIFLSVEINGNAERCTDLVLAAVAFADAAGLIVIDVERLGEISVHGFSLVRELFRKWQNGGLVGGQERMDFHDSSGIAKFQAILKFEKHEDMDIEICYYNYQYAINEPVPDDFQSYEEGEPFYLEEGAVVEE